MKKQLILEIGTEELPPSCAAEGLAGLKKILGNNLAGSRIDYRELKTFISPRRLTALVEGLDDMQRSEEKTVTGPPKKIAFDSNGKPTKAAEGFARSLNLKVADLEEIEVEGRGIYLGKKIVDPGEKTAGVLPDILKETILSLTFSKQMAWADHDIRFVRPIRWILALYGSDIVDFRIAGINSSNMTSGHRTLSPDPIKVKNAEDYFKLLNDDGKVIVDPVKRREIITGGIRKLETGKWKDKFRVIVDEDLLDDVVNLVEMPNILVGDFPEDFLYIPTDILIEAIQHHQKYFAVLDTAGKVTTKFIIISNGIKDDGGIRKGNERVLGARLSDASFFYEEDKKNDFKYWSDKLEGVIFYYGLGSMKEKSQRLAKISSHLAGLIKNKKSLLQKGFSDDLKRASLLCKCDLVTNMVVEFPKLQGIVGREYAREKGEKESVYRAIFEHYQPRFAGDQLPETPAGQILSIADKIDTITGMFMAGNVPSGSEDPFALRRKASGIVRTVLKGGYDISLVDLIEFTKDQYLKSFDFKGTDIDKVVKDIWVFIIARYSFLLEKEKKRLDILESILNAHEGRHSIIDIDLRYKAIEDFITERDIKNITAPMVRCKNISGKVNDSQVKASLFEDEMEEKLFSALNNIKDIITGQIAGKDYGKALGQLEGFGKTVDLFFDKVMVMAEDKKVRSNRLNLVRDTSYLYLKFADFSRLVIEGDKNIK